MKTKRNKKKQTGKFYKIISILLIITSIIFEGILLYIDLLPKKYMIVISVFVLGFALFNAFFINLKRLKRKVKKFISVVILIFIILISIGSFYICRTFGILSSNGDGKYKLEHYSVIVLKDSKYNKITDIKNEKVGYFKNSVGSKESKKRLNKDVKVNFESYSSSSDLMNELISSEINIILVEDSIKKIMEEESLEFSNSTKTIYTFTIKVEIESTLKDVNVTKEPFAIYLSGIDTYGEISSVSRSDVNIVAVVNPNTNQILLISIPRDYYVQLHGKTGSKDKLTHASIYGIDMSIKTIEDLLECNINYYIKVNFTSVIDIVDALGGLDVYSECSFVSYSGYSFKEGLNSVNGEEALDFVRTRKAFVTGDIQRGKNQQALIEAIIRKATSKSIITKYNSLLNAIDGKYQTNMGIKKITSLIKKQLNDMDSWNITSYSLTGTNSSNYTYTYNHLLYVMEPDQDSVNTAIKMIEQVLSGELLENSYDDISGNVNKVVTVNPPKKETPITKEEKEEIIKEYTIIFEPDNGSKIFNQIEEEGSKVKIPKEPINEGYEFIGWYLNKELYDFDSVVNSDITLTAKWKKVEEDIDKPNDETDNKKDNNDSDENIDDSQKEDLELKEDNNNNDLSLEEKE